MIQVFQFLGGRAESVLFDHLLPINPEENVQHPLSNI